MEFDISLSLYFINVEVGSYIRSVEAPSVPHTAHILVHCHHEDVIKL